MSCYPESPSHTGYLEALVSLMSSLIEQLKEQEEVDAGVGVADRDQGPPKQTPSPLKASSMGGQPDTDLLLWVPGGRVCSLSSACDHNCLPIDGGLGCKTQGEKLALQVV